MSILRPISIVLRNFLVKQHPYFSCCASCGEIATPLEGRLCTSLKAGFVVDAVILPKGKDQKARLARARAVRAAAPWIRRIYALHQQDPDEHAPETPPSLDGLADIRLCDPRSLLASEIIGNSLAEVLADAAEREAVARRLPVDALLHALPGIARHFLVLHAPDTTRLRSPLDYFTPNGIPLIFVKRVPEETAACYSAEEALRAMRAIAGGKPSIPWPPIPYAYPQTAPCCASFFPGFAAIAAARLRSFPDRPLRSADYVPMAARWMFSSQQGILSPLEGTGTAMVGLESAGQGVAL